MFKPYYDLHPRLPGPSMHAFIPPPPPFAAIFPYLECGHLVRHIATGKFTTSVILDSCPAAKDGHDAGYGIPHATIPNAGIALAIAFSAYKLLFGSSTVKADGDPFAIGMGPELYCADPLSLPAPSGMMVNSVFQHSVTVFIGGTLGDLVLGCGAMGFEMAMDGLTTFLFGLPKGWGKAGEKICRGFVNKYTENTVKGVIGSVLKFLWEQGEKWSVELPVLGFSVGEEKTGTGVKLQAQPNPMKPWILNPKSRIIPKAE